MTFESGNSEPGATIRDLKAGVSLADAFRTVRNEQSVPFEYFLDEMDDYQDEIDVPVIFSFSFRALIKRRHYSERSSIVCLWRYSFRDELSH